MKQLIILLVTGGAAFFVTGILSFAIYWNAPIVPCEVETRTPSRWGGYNTRRHDDFCTGSQVKGYEYPRVHHRKTKADKGVIMGLSLLTFLVGVGAGVGGLMLSGRKKSTPTPPGQQPIIPAG
ncbi:MAG: hypothetical protein AB7K71_29790 [Polyangiaceae bacterium]